MKAIKSWSIILFFTMTVHLLKAQQPTYYWSFNNEPVLRSDIGNKLIDPNTYKCGYTTGKGKAGNAIFPNSNGCLLVTNALPANTKVKGLTVSFMFKGNKIYYTSFPAASYRLVMDYSFLQFSTTVSVRNNAVTDNWVIQLNSNDILSYNYLTNGDWHYMVFRIDGASGEKEIWIDGRTRKELQKQVGAFDYLMVSGGDGFKLTEGLDELAVYNSAIPDKMIRQQSAKLMPADGNETVAFDQLQKTEIVSPGVNGMDPKEFAPGYPNYTTQAVDQLTSFPAPRFGKKKMNRNFSWMDITYLNRTRNGNEKGFGKTSPDNAVKIVDELTANWNYYAEVPCLRTDASSADKVYSDPGTVENALIRFANQHPEIPVGVITNQAQVKPVNAGFDSPSPYINSQNLPASYYLRNNNGNVITDNGKKWLSPVAPLDIIAKDANTTVFYLGRLMKYLKRPIDIINENGENYGHMRPESLFDQDPAVKSLKKRMGLTNYSFNGWFENRLDSTYKNTILSAPSLNNTKYSLYNVTAVNASYWSDYSMRRFINSKFDGSPRSTPSFYPSSPSNWRIANGPRNGFGVIADGRQQEIGLGTKFFSPFISAGWGLEENNIRPAQWLSLLKAMGMLGADFFYVGYFNVTGATGWPDGKGPNDPRGYIYQAAMPVYAQAIMSKAAIFFDQGNLLNPAKSSGDMPFRFKGNRENELILVRKTGSRYLIYGSIQPNSNILGNAPVTANTSISLDGMNVKFPVRRQGSVFVLDVSDRKNPLFFQLDGWHQYEHPSYWTSDIELEAELAAFEDQSFSLIKTDRAGNDLDFNNTVSYVQLPASRALNMQFSARKSGTNYCYVRAAVSDNNAGKLTIALNGRTNASITLKGNSWAWYRIDNLRLQADQLNNLKVSASSNIRIDKFLITTNSKIVE
ncbi:MAG: hypothetical protein J7578_13020 [Chitinophagaceae bacterium]|nr:hypothetical protein [Chitinophagaceae bacterium]